MDSRYAWNGSSSSKSIIFNRGVVFWLRGGLLFHNVFNQVIGGLKQTTKMFSRYKFGDVTLIIKIIN